MRNVYANTPVGVDIDIPTSPPVQQSVLPAVTLTDGNFPNKLEQTILIDSMNEPSLTCGSALLCTMLLRRLHD